MSQASGTIYPELWSAKTLQQMIAEMRSGKVRVLNTLTDYTPFVKNKQAAGYHGPKVSGISAQNVAVGASFSDPGDATHESIDIAFNLKIGAPFRVYDVQEAQTNLNLMNIYTGDAKNAILDGYDLALAKALIASVSTATPDHLVPQNDTVNYKLTEADIKAAKKALDVAKAPKKGRYMLVGPNWENDLFDISNFISRDKIAKTEAVPEGVIGRVYGFDVVSFADMVDVDDDGTYSLTSENNTNSCAVFYQSLAIGWGRQLELKTKIEAEALSSSDLVNPYSVWGWTVQKSDYIYVVYDSEDNDAT
jgi:hypothetical protein